MNRFAHTRSHHQLGSRGTTFWLLCTCLLLSSTASSDITTERIVSGLDRPVFVTSPADDIHRLFIVEQRGEIRIIEDGVLLPDPFLDVSDLIMTGGFNDERGLLGLAFHPDYVSNGYFYLNYNDLEDSTTIVRYEVSENPNLAEPDSARILMKIYQPFGNHNGGTLLFGPNDGYLYIGMGDGGGSGDPGNRAQNDGLLLGKMLRIDVDGGFPYVIPLDNPHLGPGDPLDEIWAKGLRNPYRWSFDRLTGDMYIADVGQWEWEEIDYQPADSPGGENYGWRLMEGTHCFSPPSDCDPGGLTYPVHEYPHDDGCSVTGGYVYRGTAIPEIQGHYFFGDWCSARIWSFKLVNGQVTEFQERTAELAPGGGLSIQGISGFGEDARGEMYIIDRSATGQGEVYRIVPDPTPVEDSGQLPQPFQLEQNHPNPFNPHTVIAFALQQERQVELAVYTTDGHRVRTLVLDRLSAGHHEVSWNGRDEAGRILPSGTYIYRLESGEQVQTRVMTLLK